ncbi:hypothetical protein QR680_004695 [Steinernema hermaphroditum]|uniref:G-protein coupled receptors family 1 profile domain-containing protein n=1 Tax=Steinernema hermaphroditum TaxID=289476 RepID=A0AA39HPI6_9BILA|nr:hypothetical protein QR680_004695 [Steinernema hermaphroditum]
MTSNNTVFAIPEVRIFGATSYAVLCGFGLFANILLLAVFVKGRSEYRQVPFFVIACQLMLCDVVTHIVQFAIAVPITYTGRAIYGNSLLLHAPALCDTIAYNGTLLFSFLMTVNRITVFLLPHVHFKLFNRSSIVYTIGAVWLLVFVYVAALNLDGCYKSFDSNGFFLFHDCSSRGGKGALLLIGTTASTGLPIVMLCSYLLLFGVVRFSSKNAVRQNNRQREYSLLAQSFLICGFLEIQNIAFTVLPMIQPGGQWNLVMNFLQNWISIINSTVNPIVYFTFNKGIRHRAMRLFGASTTYDFQRTNKVATIAYATSRSTTRSR